MSLQAIRPYITKQIESLGYKEHIDPFNDENIPAPFLDKGFHQMFMPMSGADRTNIVQGVHVPVQIKAFYKGFRSPEDALTQSIEQAEEILVALVKHKNYGANTPPITSVSLDSISFEPYDNTSNDTIIMVVFVFSFSVYICTD